MPLLHDIIFTLKDFERFQGQFQLNRSKVLKHHQILQIFKILVFIFF